MLIRNYDNYNLWKRRKCNQRACTHLLQFLHTFWSILHRNKPSALKRSHKRIKKSRCHHSPTHQSSVHLRSTEIKDGYCLSCGIAPNGSFWIENPSVQYSEETHTGIQSLHDAVSNVCAESCHFVNDIQNCIFDANKEGD